MKRKKLSGEELRTIRKEAGYTQATLAARLAISRETVSAIENDKQGSMVNLSMEITSRWWKVCRPSLGHETRERFLEALKAYFNIA